MSGSLFFKPGTRLFFDVCRREGDQLSDFHFVNLNVEAKKPEGFHLRPTNHPTPDS